MKLDQSEKTRLYRNRDGAKPSSRRNFLHKSSAAALVTSLASRPVWGQCSVSGAMSGASNAQTTEDSCVIPNVLGRSPGFYTQAMYNGNGNPLLSAFPNIPNSKKEQLRCYIDEIKQTQSYTIPATTPGSSEQVYNVGDALGNNGSNGGNNWNLAAIWLDAYFGFFDGTAVPGRSTSTPQDWVEHFFALSVLLGDDSAFDAVLDNDLSWTSWDLLPDDYSCS